jgi:DNA-binding winged helix-turn-helix (wHTH) protein
MLKLFLARPDQPLKRAEIIARAWGDEAYPTERTVDNFIWKLRKKIEDDPQNPRFLQTVHRVGYRFTLRRDEISSACDACVTTRTAGSAKPEREPRTGDSSC